MSMKQIIKMVVSHHTVSQKINFLRHKFAHRKEILKYDPVTISIVATGRCTLSCDMCPTHSSKVPRDYPNIQNNIRDMNFEMFKHIIDKFRNAVTIQIIGSGEPLLNHDFFN